MRSFIKLMCLVGILCVSSTAAVAGNTGYSNFIFTNNSGKNLIVQMFKIDYDGSEEMVAGAVVYDGDQDILKYNSSVRRNQTEVHEFELRIHPTLVPADAVVSSTHSYRRGNHSGPGLVTCNEIGTYVLYHNDNIDYSVVTDESSITSRCTVYVTLNHY